MARIIAALALSALLAGCATYTERTSPCVCNWQPVNVTGEATV
ncbi:hypothetical protein [uncultured Jannaschia sp.]|nr:hypothetical protein [uncultured Jannaschia sp.]